MDSRAALEPTLPAVAGDQAQDGLIAAETAVGDYVVERFIGAGAMGEVYAGRHPVIGKRVAIKVLRHALAGSSEAAERFVREARAVNQVDHDNVVDVFAFGRLADGRLYLVMDLVEGRSLRAWLVDGPLEVGFALDVLDAVAGALDAAHARGVVHRDLKPDNIVLSSATPPRVFVLDFGIAKLVSAASDAAAEGPGTLTGRGTWVGTPAYMAPEQWSADGAGPASDRYALGVIAFELLTGAPPFTAANVPQMMEQHFRATVPALSARGATALPAVLDDVLGRALAKDPEARFPTARALVDALRAAAGSGAGGTRAAAAAQGRARSRWVPAAAGVGVLGMSVAVLVLGRQAPEREDSSRPATAQAAAAGAVTITVVSSPAGAEVKASGGATGRTPARLVARTGDTLDLVVRRPGYEAVQRSLVVGADDERIEVRLVEVSRFEGVWRLDSGELRELRRRGEEVDVFKLSEVHGARALFKQYAFVSADQGVAFGGDDVVVDPRAPDDPGCHVRVRVDFHYDPLHDVLELHREKATIELTGGRCTVQARDVVVSRLVRVGESADTRELSAPVGVPIVDRDRARDAVDARPTSPVDPALEAAKREKQRKNREETARSVTPSKRPTTSKRGAVAKPVADPVVEARGDAVQAPMSKLLPGPTANAPALEPLSQDPVPRRAPQQRKN